MKVLPHFYSCEVKQHCCDQVGGCVTHKDNVMMALFKKCFDVTPGDRMGLFSRRFSLLAAEGSNFCRCFVEIWYSKWYHILFKQKKQSPKFPGKSHS